MEKIDVGPERVWEKLLFLSTAALLKSSLWGPEERWKRVVSRKEAGDSKGARQITALVGHFLA